MQHVASSDQSELGAFVALADTGSFAAAARQLNRDPTVISRRVQALEARLGVRLAERTTRQISLTEAGRAYLARVRPLLRDIETADREAAAFVGGEPRGHLRLAIPGSFGRLWLKPLIVEFLCKHPQVTMDVDMSSRFVDLIGERYDIAVRLGELPDSRLITRKIAPRRRLVCAAPSYLSGQSPIVVPEDLANHACLISPAHIEPYRWAFLNGSGSRSEVTVRGPLASEDAGLLVDACVAGLGVLRTTDWYVGRELANGQLVEILADWPAVDHGAVYLVTPASAGTASKTRAFSDYMAKKLVLPPWAPNT